MHPILLKIGSLTLYTYGLFVGLGFLTAVFVASQRAKKYNIKSEQMSDLFFVILVAAIIGARLLYVAINFSEFSGHFIDIFKIWNGGLVFYGGFIAALAAAIVYIKRTGLLMWQTGDIIAPGIALGHAIGRLGCFSAGCCYGKHCSLPWAVTFTDPNSLAPLGVPLHPTQLYSVLSNFTIFLILLWIDKRKKFDGMVFWSYILLYGIFRSFIEIFRGDPRGYFPFLHFLSISQGIGIIMALIAIFMLFNLLGSSNDFSDKK